MLEVNIRIFFPKNGAGLFPDYHEHVELLEAELKGKVRAYVDETEAIPIYQYYSIAPFGCVEARYLKRMQIGKSIMYIREGIDTYMKNIHIPLLLKKIFFQYLKLYLNSLDYIVVPDFAVEEVLKKEGIQAPKFCAISMEKERRSLRAGQWLRLYQEMEESA